MTNEGAQEFADDLTASIRRRARDIAAMHQRWAEMTATGSAAGKRVTVVVNAEGVVIETRFTADAEELTLTELAHAVTSAAQAAAAAAKKNTEELKRPLQEQRAARPKIADFFPELADLGENFMYPPEVSTAPPDAPERAKATEASSGANREQGFSQVFDRSSKPAR